MGIEFKIVDLPRVDGAHRGNQIYTVLKEIILFASLFDKANFSDRYNALADEAHRLYGGLEAYCSKAAESLVEEERNVAIAAQKELPNLRRAMYQVFNERSRVGIKMLELIEMVLTIDTKFRIRSY